MKNLQKGFTLIELMIVVAIVAILAAIAIPQYQNYVAKAQFSESQTIADGLKTPIAEFFNQTGQCPTANQGSLASSDSSYSGKYVAKATAGPAGGSAGPCTIDVTFKGAGSVSTPLIDQTVTFKGTNMGGTFTWECSSTINPKYKPTTCS